MCIYLLGRISVFHSYLVIAMSLTELCQVHDEQLCGLKK